MSSKVKVTGTLEDQRRAELNAAALEQVTDRIYIRANEFATALLYGKLVVEVIIQEGLINEFRVQAHEVNRLGVQP